MRGSGVLFGRFAFFVCMWIIFVDVRLLCSLSVREEGAVSCRDVVLWRIPMKDIPARVQPELQKIT